MKFSYASEKFSVARRCLMLPHYKSEAESIGEAFHNCYIGLCDIDRNDLDSDALQWVSELDELMSFTGVTAEEGEGLYLARAKQLNYDQKLDLSRIVDELADWFDRADDL
jgi:hypothetical protein